MQSQALSLFKSLLVPAGCVTLSEIFTLTESQFSHRQIRKMNTFLTRLLERLQDNIRKGSGTMPVPQQVLGDGNC